MTFSEKILRFYSDLHINEQLPPDVEVMNPYLNSETFKICQQFYSKYYNDHNKRRIIFGINPGRFGAGVTGISFTDPVQLEKSCGIKNNFDKKSELSSVFIYQLISQMGGPDHFFKHYFITSVSPLGFIKNGKNYNYYDSLDLQKRLKSFILHTMIQQIAFGVDTKKCFSLGQGKNFEYLNMLNTKYHLFDEIVPLPHPRWIMQYKRKHLNTFLNDISRQLSI